MTEPKVDPGSHVIPLSGGAKKYCLRSSTHQASNAHQLHTKECHATRLRINDQEGIVRLRMQDKNVGSRAVLNA
jgi:hypothetical protein